MNNKIHCIPQDDLDCYYNTHMHKIYAGKIFNDSFSIVQNEIDGFLINFIKNAKTGQNIQMDKLVKFRTSFYERKNNNHFLRTLVKNIDNISDTTSLAITMKMLISHNIIQLFRLEVMPHLYDGKQYVLSVGELEPEITSTKMISDYLVDMHKVYQYIKKNMLNNIQPYHIFARDAIIFQLMLAKTMLPILDSLDPRTYHFISYDDFIKKFDQDHFWEIVIGPFATNNIICYQNYHNLYFWKNFLSKNTPKNLSMFKNYLLYMVGSKFIIYDTTKKQNILDIFGQTFGYYLESIYEEKYGNIAKKQYVAEMFQKMKTYCIKNFLNNEIFSVMAQYGALEKIKKINIVIGNQDYRIDTFPDLTDNFYQNLAIIENFYFSKTMQLIGQNINNKYLSFNRDLYSFIINAYYDPCTNNVFIPTSILNTPFFHLEYDPIENYGSMGCILGHEMMHCVDNYGILFNAQGKIKKWWTNNDREKFMIELDKIKNHYKSIILSDPKNSKLLPDPSISMSENMADILGIKLSFRTYLAQYFPYINLDKSSIQIKNYLKKFFKKWANVMTIPLIDDAQTDVHAPSKIRINVPFSHLDEYYNIYDVRPYHHNFIDKKNRITLY